MPLSAPIQSGGTFTPILSFGGASVGITYSTQLGNYTKIGDRTFFTITITLTSKGSSVGVAAIAGLPNTSSVTINQNCAIRGIAMGASVNTMQAYVGAGSNSVLLDRIAAGALTNMTDTDFNAASSINISGHYI